VTKRLRTLLCAGLLALSAAVSGCSFFHDDFPDRSCNTNEDCFVAQGEICSAEKLCVPRADAGPAADARQTPDAATSTPDADTSTPDADTSTPDATTADAS